MEETKANYASTLETKLNRPQLFKDCIPRLRLLDILNKQSNQTFTLVSAPAGYGKSILISSWLEASDCANAWVSLDKNDNDLRIFLTYFVAAVNRLFPDAITKTRSMLESADLPPASVLAHTLINELNLIKQRFILVLDDYHFIKEASIHDLLTEILNHPPQSLHIVVGTRHDPPLQIFKYRAAGKVTEIGAQDLSFSITETKTFLQNILETPVDDTFVAALNEKTEGWVTGLRLAAIVMQHHGDIAGTLPERHTDMQYVMEYLFNEVFAHQPPECKQYLLNSAILDRFCGPLCDAVNDTEDRSDQDQMDGWEFIARLKKKNLFLIDLDVENRWFRYHHLFQNFLTNQLQRCCSAGEITTYHSRAGAWFAENGLIDEAIKHLLAAGDEIGAAQLVEQHRVEVLGSDRWYMLEKWLSMLSDTVIQQRPELLLAQAWVCYYHYNYALTPAIIDVAESLLGKTPKEQPIYGEIYFFRGMAAFFQGNGALSLKYIEDALQRIPIAYHMIRGVTEVYFGLAGQMHGQKERVMQVLSDLLHQKSLHDKRKVHLMVSLVCIETISGNLTVASTLNQQLSHFARSINSVSYKAWSLYFQGHIHFCRNELDKAIHYFSEATTLSYILVRRGSVDCMAGLVLAYQALQQADKADSTLERLFEYIHSIDDSALLDIAHSCRARLSLMRGETPFASGLEDINIISGGGAMIFWLEIPAITQCRVLVAEGSETGLREAEKKIRELLRLSQEQHCTFQMVFIMALQALTFEKQGRTDDALAILAEAVDLARAGGFIRPFVELGPTMEGLLKRLGRKKIAVDYIRKVLDCFSTTSYAPPLSVMPVKGLLTNREMDILDQLAQRFQSKEIAQNLFISTETVNFHLKNIYKKLNVHNRRQAVIRAQDLGLL